MRLSNRKIILILSISSFLMLTLYWVLSEILFKENNESQFDKIQNYSPWKKSLRYVYKANKRSQEDLATTINSDARSNFDRHFAKYSIMAVRMNNKSTFSTDLACVSELFVLDCDNAGLAGLLLMTLDHIGTCREIGATPTVFWRNCHTVCPSNGTVNAWDWYFEPINPNIEKKFKKVLCLANYVGPEIVSLKSGSRRRKNNHTHPFDLLNLSFQPRNKPGFSNLAFITREARQWANSLLRQYVRVNFEIQEIVDKFYDQHMFGYTVLAVHIRGTDHYIETGDGKLPPLNSWIQNAKYILKSLPAPNKIFIASDNSESIKKFFTEFGKKVVFTKALRAVKYHGKEVHHSKYDPYKLGSQVLIDILLMAKCDHFLHAESSVASLVSFFNPDMHTHFLEFKAKNRNKEDIAKSSQFGHIGDVNVNMENSQYGDFSKSSEAESKKETEEAFYCYKMNSKYSACPNMKKGIFVDVTKLNEL